MEISAQRLSLVFAAGAVGGLVNSLAVWGFGELAITIKLGARMPPPSLTAGWLYPRLVWGGIWGALFLLPVLKKRMVWRGLLFSLGPTLLQLLYFFPRSGAGIAGTELGLTTPLFVLFFNAIWGLATSLWLHWSDYSD